MQRQTSDIWGGGKKKSYLASIGHRRAVSGKLAGLEKLPVENPA